MDLSAESTMKLSNEEKRCSDILLLAKRLDAIERRLSAMEEKKQFEKIGEWE